MCLHDHNLTADSFKENMDKALMDRHTFGVYETGRRVAKRLYGHFVKPVKEAGMQTESLDEIVKGYCDEIKAL